MTRTLSDGKHWKGEGKEGLTREVKAHCQPQQLLLFFLKAERNKVSKNINPA